MVGRAWWLLAVSLAAPAGPGAGAPAAGAARARGLAACPEGMVGFPGGAYTLRQRGTRGKVRPFCLDRTEVTAAAYLACAREGGCPPAAPGVDWPGIRAAEREAQSLLCNAAAPGRLDHPMNCVDWGAASAYCRSRGKRLPTEEEWEWAARGGRAARIYPWGDEPPGDQVCWNRGQPARAGTCPAGSHPAGASPEGLLDMAGNVWEWTASLNREGPERVSRGGGWSYHGPMVVSAEYRGWNDPGMRTASLGFRCARDR